MDYEKIRNRDNLAAARFSIERHIKAFNRLSDDGTELKSVLDASNNHKDGEGVFKLVERARTMVLWLKDVLEASASNPASVMVKFWSEEFIFQREDARQ